MSGLSTSSKLFVASAGAALAIVGGAGFAMAQDANAGSSDSQQQTQQTQQQSPRHKGQHGMPGAMHGGMKQDETELAAKLGVTEQQLSDAFAKIKPQEKGGDRTSDLASDYSNREQALADALGKKVEDVHSALETMRASHDKQARDNLSSRLDQAVTAGKITLSDKDSILKGFDAGALMPGGHGHPERTVSN